jgi:hypothetical protein
MRTGTYRVKVLAGSIAFAVTGMALGTVAGSQLLITG